MYDREQVSLTNKLRRREKNGREIPRRVPSLMWGDSICDFLVFFRRERESRRRVRQRLEKNGRC